MATVTKSIGTASRDYSTITAWEADLDNTTLYDAGDVAVGECYDDAAFNEEVNVNGGGTVGLASVQLTVAAGHRHDGTAGTGARIVRTSAFNVLFQQSVTGSISWLELNGNGTNSSRCIGNGTDGAETFSVERCLLHGISSNHGSGQGGIDGGTGNRQLTAINNIIWGIVNTDTGTVSAYGIKALATSTHHIANNTIHGVTNDGGSGTAYGIDYANDADTTLRNNLVVDTGGTTSGTKADFNSAGTTATRSNNLSSDATAPGTGSLTSKTAANQFVSTTSGSEDCHLKSGADAIDAGYDMGTTPTGVNLDINGRDRDAEGDTWDIGAHEYVTVGGDTPKSASDTLTVTLSDVPALTADLSGSDTAALSLAESAALSAALEVAETFGLSLVESAALAADLVAADSLPLSLTETSGLAAQVAASDTLPLLTSESPSLDGSDAKAASDTLALALSESATLATEILGTDSLLIGIVEGPTLAAALADSDTLSLVVSEVPALTADLAAADTVALVVTESGEVATVDSVVSSDTLALALTELTAMAAQLAGSDTLAVALTEVPGLAAVLASSETLALAVAHGSSVIIDGLTITAGRTGRVTLGGPRAGRITLGGPSVGRVTLEP